MLVTKRALLQQLEFEMVQTHIPAMPPSVVRLESMSKSEESMDEEDEDHFVI